MLSVDGRSGSGLPPGMEIPGTIEKLVKGYYEELIRITGSGGWYESDGRRFTRVINGFFVEVSLDNSVGDEVRANHTRSLAVDLSTPDLESAFGVFGYLAHRYYEGHLADSVVLVAPTNKEQIEARGLDISLKGYNLKWDGMREMPGSGKESRFVGSFEDVKKAVVGHRIDFSEVWPDYSRTEAIKFSTDKKGIGSLTLHGKETTGDHYRIEHLFAGTEKDVISYAADVDRAILRQ